MSKKILKNEQLYNSKNCPVHGDGSQSIFPLVFGQNNFYYPLIIIVILNLKSIKIAFNTYDSERSFIRNYDIIICYYISCTL